MKAANKFSTLSIIGVFLITLINVLISTFNGSNFSPEGSKTDTTTIASADASVATTESV